MSIDRLRVMELREINILGPSEVISIIFSSGPGPVQYFRH